MSVEINCSSADAWFVANTHSNREVLAASNLRNQGYHVYAPLIRKQTRHARRVQDVLRPLFPGYLFVRLHVPEMRWRPILSTMGVRSVVCNGDAPSLLPGSVVVALKEREKDGVIARTAAPRDVGDTVRLARGPFEGLAANIIELCEKERLVVLMTLLNRPVKVTVSEDQLSAF